MKRTGFKRKIGKPMKRSSFRRRNSSIKREIDLGASGIPKVKIVKLGKLRRTCDALMQQIGKLKYPRSLLSALPTQVMHHLVPKSVSSMLRYNWDNLIPLTNAEHCRLHQSPDPTIEMKIVSIKGGTDWFFELRQKGRQINKINRAYYESKKLELEEELRVLQNY